MPTKKRCLAALSAAILGGLISAQTPPPLASIMDATTLAQLQGNGRMVVTTSGKDAANAVIGLAHPGMDLIRKETRASKPGMLVEALFLLARPAGAESKADFAKVFKVLTEIASLQGIEYWSESRGKWRTFYVESWRIDGPKTRKRLPDEIPGDGQRQLSLFAWQQDLSFGGNVYSYEYSVEGLASAPALLVTQTNLTRMSYNLIPLVGEGGLKTRLLIVPTKEGILFYAASAVNSPPLPILSGKLEDSFSNRAAALFKWFGARMKAGE